MKNESAVLIQKKGIWYLNDVVLQVGSQVTIDGVVWGVLAVGRSRSESQAPFMWIRNEQYGTTIYAPSIVEHRPRLKVYPREESLNYCMTAA